MVVSYTCPEAFGFQRVINFCMSSISLQSSSGGGCSSYAVDDPPVHVVITKRISFSGNVFDFLGHCLLCWRTHTYQVCRA